jgi:hypothetical protein
LKCDAVDTADNDYVNISAVVPFAGTIKACWIGTQTLITLGDFYLFKNATTDIALLATSPFVLDAATTTLVAKTGKSLTLTTTTPYLKVAAGDMLTATWFLEDITASADATLSCTVVIEADEW